MGPRTQTRTHSHQVRFTHLSLAIALCFAIAILFARPSIAQTFTASIAGTVTYPTGAIVRGAKLQLQNSDTTKDMRLQTSGNDGA